MGVNDIILDLEKEIKDIAIMDQVQAVKELIRTPISFFLDTCFVSRNSLYKDDTKIISLFKKIAAEKPGKRVLVIVTSLVLYEMRDSGNKLSRYSKQLFNVMHDAGVTIAYLREEAIAKEIAEYTRLSPAELNKLFVKRLCENKANLTMLKSIIYSDEKLRKIYEVEYKASSSSEFIAGFLSQVKEKKENEDSLAEELISLVIILLLELPNNREYVLCTNDLAAIARFNKSICTSAPSTRHRVSAMSAFTATQAMIEHGIVKEDDKDNLRKVLTACVGENVIVVEVKESPYHPTEIRLNVQELLEGMFAGKIYLMKGRT